MIINIVEYVYIGGFFFVKVNISFWQLFALVQDKCIGGKYTLNVYSVLAGLKMLN